MTTSLLLRIKYRNGHAANHITIDPRVSHAFEHALVVILGLIATRLARQNCKEMYAWHYGLLYWR